MSLLQKRFKSGSRDGQQNKKRSVEGKRYVICGDPVPKSAVMNYLFFAAICLLFHSPWSVLSLGRLDEDECINVENQNCANGHDTPSSSNDGTSEQQSPNKHQETRGLLEETKESTIEPLHRWQRAWTLLIHNALLKIHALSSLGYERVDSPTRRVLESARSVALTKNGKRPHARSFSPLSQEMVEESPLVCYDNREMSDNIGYSNAIEPHIGMILDIFVEEEEGERYDDISGLAHKTCHSTFAVRYELLEPLHNDLGTTVKHTMDFAYIPVVADKVEPLNAHLQNQPILSSLYKDKEYDDGVDKGSPFTEKKEAAISNRPRSAPDRGRQHEWWQWWIPWWRWDGSEDHSFQYRMHTAFAGGSHGDVWRGARRCHSVHNEREGKCDEDETLIFKRLKVENGYRVLEAGLREIFFGRWLAEQTVADQYTKYVDHFFREQNNALELWIVFENAGPSLRSFLYTGTTYGDFVVYQHSLLWTQLRLSVSGNHSRALSVNPTSRGVSEETDQHEAYAAPGVGKALMKDVLKQILEAAAFLHESGVVHRDIKPSNIMCETNIEWDETQVMIPEDYRVKCRLGDFSSAWSNQTQHLYTGGPTQLEHTDEYAPPEALFRPKYSSDWLPHPTFDSWSIGIVALELLLGTPNVFTVDHRTKAILTHKMKLQRASDIEIERALYLAALSQFCIYNNAYNSGAEWPLGKGDPLHESNFVKQSCTIEDFQRALHARDPLQIGFDSSTETLLHLIWQLLSFDPGERITASEALDHPYIKSLSEESDSNLSEGALESQMLDPRMDMGPRDGVEKFVCPKCGREFTDWFSCKQHAQGRKHARFCKYERSHLPTCLNAHTMLPVHASSGHCDIRGRRKVIEDFHAVQLREDEEFYGIFDGHNGNLASKYATSFLFDALRDRLTIDSSDLQAGDKQTLLDSVAEQTSAAFHDIHNGFLKAIGSRSGSNKDQSGTTATIMLVKADSVLVASLGDSRAVLSTSRNGDVTGIQLTKDHTAADLNEQRAVEERGGFVVKRNGVTRVNGALVVTRSIGDESLAPYLSQTPDIHLWSKDELLSMCGEFSDSDIVPCFMILASDGLWDTVGNHEAVQLVQEIVIASSNHSSWDENFSLQQAAEALVHEAYVRGSTDNIGVCVVALVSSQYGRRQHKE